ncbi:MAG: hypothetical protein JWR38_1724 [Mucilaginibacter sp.]|nr:hypothetical protein [Mucilaginibacter sp.]
MSKNIEGQLSLFEAQHKLIITEDLKSYFRSFNANKYDLDMFAFYGFDQFKSVRDEVGDYGGAPNYTNIVNVLPAHERCFVFMEYFTHVSVYAIRLYEHSSSINEIYAICGDSFKVVANSFTEFLELYFSEDQSIYI